MFKPALKKEVPVTGRINSRVANWIIAKMKMYFSNIYVVFKENDNGRITFEDQD